LKIVNSAGMLLSSINLYLSCSLGNCLMQKTLEKKIRKGSPVCWNRSPFLVSSWL